MSPRKLAAAPLSVAVLATSVLAALGAAPPANADVTPQAAAAALDAPQGASIALSGSAAVESTAFNDFPSKGSQYLVLSTGHADDVMLGSPLTIDDPRTSLNEAQPDPLLSTARTGNPALPDESSLTLTIDESVSAGCLFVDYFLATDEEPREYTADTPADQFSIIRPSQPDVELALNAGRGYFPQDGWPTEPRPYTTNAIDYWHKPGDHRSDPKVDGERYQPALDRWTGLTNVTTRDTARIPLDFAHGDEVFDLTVFDFGNGERDTAAFIDNVRLDSSCDVGSGAQPGHPWGADEGSIKGERRVGYPLSYDPVPSTAAIESYLPAANDWIPSDKPVDLRFRWYRTSSIYADSTDMVRWTAIPNADRQTYVLTKNDLSPTPRRLIVLVTAVVDGRRFATFPNTGDPSPNQWYVTDPIDAGVFQEGARPTIVHDGSPKVREVLSARPTATWPLQDRWSYRWYADGRLISGATGATLPLGANERGAAITVRATAEREGFDDRTWESLPTPAVAGDPMEDWGQPSIVQKTAVVGDQLTVDVGEICPFDNPASGSCADRWPHDTEFTYQWRRGTEIISGATGATYATSLKDAGAAVSVVVSGGPAGYDPVSVSTDPITVRGLEMEGAVPVVSGTMRVGERITGTAVGWLPERSALDFAWYAGDVLLGEGAVRTITIPPSAAGERIVLRVTGSKAGYETTTRESAPTAVVAPGVLSSAVPRIIGSARVGQTLTLIPGYWGPSGVKVAYRWKVGSRVVSGAKGARSTFKIPKTARGKRITVAATGTLRGYTTVTKRSQPTDRVQRPR